MEQNTKREELFVTPSDKIHLISEGVLYQNIPAVLDVEYMITQDEDLLFSNNLIDHGLVFNTLVAKKVKDKSINIGDLLIADFNQILVFLRKSAYGEIYKTKVYDKDMEDYVTHDVDLNLLTHKKLSAEFNENGEFEYVLPLTNKRITFKLPTVAMGDFINKTAEDRKDKTTGAIPYITTKLETMITSIERETSKMYINKFVNHMPPRDRLAFTQYVDKIEPKVDLDYTFKSTIKGDPFNSKIILSLDFFYPTSI